MKNLTLLACLFVCVGLMSCKGKKMETDYDAMAKELCACMSPLVEMNEKIQSLTESGDTEAVGELFAQLEGEFAAGEKCAADLEKKYGAMNEAGEEAKAKAAIRKTCPKVADMIDQSVDLE